MVVGEVPVEDVLKVALVADDHVVQAVSAEGANHAFAKSVGRWRSRWGWEQARAESPHAAAEQTTKDGVAVVDQEPGDVVRIDGRLDDPLGCPRCARMLGDANVDQAAPTEGEDDEDVEHAEPGRDDYEEVAGPSLVQVVPDEVIQRCPRRRARPEERYLATVRGETW